MGDVIIAAAYVVGQVEKLVGYTKVPHNIIDKYVRLVGLLDSLTNTVVTYIEKPKDPCGKVREITMAMFDDLTNAIQDLLRSIADFHRQNPDMFKEIVVKKMNDQLFYEIVVRTSEFHYENPEVSLGDLLLTIGNIVGERDINVWRDIVSRSPIITYASRLYYAWDNAIIDERYKQLQCILILIDHIVNNLNSQKIKDTYDEQKKKTEVMRFILQKLEEVVELGTQTKSSGASQEESAIQKFSEHGLIDNQKVELLKILKEVLISGNYSEIDITVGFLFLSGLQSLEKELGVFFKNGGKIRIVMGSTTNKETYEMLAVAYQSIQDLKEIWNERFFNEGTIDGEIDAYSSTIGVMEQNNRNAEFLMKFKEWIEKGSLQIRVYTKEYMHAKSYLFKTKSGSMLWFGSVGSSNFSLAGFAGNTELNAIITSVHMTNLNEWFEKIWDEAEDFNPHLLNIIKENWPSHEPGDFPPPYHVFIRGLIELYGALEEQGNVVAPSILEQLYDFQRDAVKRAVDIINKYGGVLISDVVGLGKSFIGLALLQHYSLKAMFAGEYRPKVAVFAPPNLVRMWENYLDRYNIKGYVFSAGILSKSPGEDGTPNEKIIEIQEKLRNVDVILIDEAHKITNPESNTYINMQRLIGDRKVILLTATPYRKSFEDIVRQIQLFMPQEYHKFPISPPRWAEVIEKVDDGELDPAYILREIMVRRTRQDIIKLYGGGEERCIRKGDKKECFPDRKLVTVTYNISSIYSIKGASKEDIDRVIKDEDGKYYDGKRPDQYNNIYEVILAGIRTMLYTRYDLYGYLREDMKNKEPYKDLKHAGRNLRGIMKTHYLKRLESSVHAFYLSLKKNIAITETFAKFVDMRYVPVGKEFDDLLYKLDEYGEPRVLTEEEMKEIIEKMKSEYRDINKSPLRKYKLNAFKVNALKNALQYDLDKMKALLRTIERIHRDVKEHPWKDDKLRTLANIVDDILSASDVSKVLVFSEYADTVNWICEGLKKMVEQEKVKHPELWMDNSGEYNFECVSSGSNVEALAARFSPKSMSKTTTYALGVTETKKELDMLISTDVLSEGMNLQDANYIINYDLHWTPYKIIQRIGRIDRIGSEHDKINVINFLPETGLEDNLNLVDKVRRRAEEFISTLGEDGQLITEEDRVNKSAMEAIYGGDLKKVEESTGGDISITTTATKILEKFRQEHPEEYENLIKVVSIRSVGSESIEKTVAFIVCSDGITPQYYTYEYKDGQWERMFLSIDYFVNHVKEDTPPAEKYDMGKYYEVAELALKEYKEMLKEIEGVEGNRRARLSKGTKDLLNRLKRIGYSSNKSQSVRELALKYRDMLLWGLNNVEAFRNQIKKITKRKEWKNRKDESVLDMVRRLLESYSIPEREKKYESKERKKEPRYKRPHIVGGLILVKSMKFK